MNKKRLVVSIGASGLSSVVGVFSQLLLVPIFLNYWGTEMYGAWLVVLAITSTLALADLGVGTSIYNELVILGVDKKWQEVNRRMWAALLTQLSFLGLGLVVISFILLLYPVCSTISPNIFSVCHVWVSVLLLGVGVAIGFAINILGAGYRACDKNAFYVNLSSVGRVIEALLLIIVLIGQKSLIIAASSQLLGRGVTVLLLYVLRPKNLEVMCHVVKFNDFNNVKKMVSNGFGYFCYGVGNLASAQLLPLFISHQVGLSFAAEITAIRQVARFGLQIGSIFFSGINPEMSLSLASGNNRSAERLQRHIEVIGWGLLLSGVITAYFIGPLLIDLWSSGKLRVTGEVLSFAVLEVFSYNLAGYALLAAWSFNKIGVNSMLYLVFQISTLAVISTLSIAHYGLIGISSVFILSNFTQYIINRRLSAQIIANV